MRKREGGRRGEQNSDRKLDYRPKSVAARLYAEEHGHTLENTSGDRTNVFEQGKPRLDGRHRRPGPETRQFNTRMSEDDYKKLYNYSRRTGRSFVDIISELIEFLPEEEDDQT